MNFNDKLKMYGFTEIRKIPKEVKRYLDLFGFDSGPCVYCRVDEIVNIYKQAAKQAIIEECVEVSNWIANELERQGSGVKEFNDLSNAEKLNLFTGFSNWRLGYETECLTAALALADGAQIDGDAVRCLELIDDALECANRLSIHTSKLLNELNRWAVSELRRQTRAAMDWLSICEFDVWYKDR